MSIMTMFFNAHAQVYVWWASPFFMPIMHVLVGGGKTSMFMLTWHKFVLKNPRPVTFTNGFFYKCFAYLGIPENRCPTNIGQGWVFNLLKIFDQESIDLTLNCQLFLGKKKTTKQG